MQGQPESPAIRFIDPQPLHGVPEGGDGPSRPRRGKTATTTERCTAGWAPPPTSTWHRWVAPRDPTNPRFGMEGTPQTLSFLSPALGRDTFPPAQGSPGPSHPQSLGTHFPHPQHPHSPTHTPLLAQPMPNPHQPPSPPDPPHSLSGDSKGDTSHPFTCTWPHGDPQVTEPCRGGPEPLSQPQAAPSPAPAWLQHHVLPGCPPRCPPYMYIYTTKPQNTRYIEIPTRGRPHTNSSRNPLRGWDCHCPSPLHFLAPTSPSLACRGWGSPHKGTLQGTAQTQPRGAGGAGLGGAEAAQGPPQPPRTQETSGEVPDRTNKQTNVRRTRQGKGDSRAPTPSQVPAPGGCQGCWLRLGLARMRGERGFWHPPKPSAQWQRGQDTIQRGGQASLKAHSCVWGCSLPAGVKGTAKRTFSHIPSQPGALGAGGSRCAPKSSPRQGSPAALSWRVPAQAALSLPPRHGLSPCPVPGSPP